MNIHKNAIQFVVVERDKLVIPCFLVHLCDLENITVTFISDWFAFVKNLQKTYVSMQQSVYQLKQSGYKVIEDNNYTVILPTHWKGGFISNYPDLFECSGDQVFEFLSRSQVELDTLLIKNNQKHHVVNYKPNPTTFVNLSIANSALFSKLAEKQGCSARIWLSIVIWWRYNENDDSFYALQTDLVKEYCQPEIFLCNNFIMVYARAQQLGNTELINWLRENINRIKWDEDLLSEVSQYHMNTCKDVDFENDIFTREKKRRNL